MYPTIYFSKTFPYGLPRAGLNPFFKKSLGDWVSLSKFPIAIVAFLSKCSQSLLGKVY